MHALPTPYLQALPLPCQCLFLRLFQRKGPLFSISSLAYAEVPDAAAAASQLAAAGLATVLGGDGAGEASPPQQVDAAAGALWGQLADLLTVPALAAVLAARRIPAAPAAQPAGGFSSGRQGGGGSLRNRQQLLAALERHAASSAAAAGRLAGWLQQATGPVLQLAAPACEAVCRLQRLFFLNEGHSLSQFLVADLGAMQYPQYLVHRSCRVFDRRQDLLAYEQALQHAVELADALEVSGGGRLPAGRARAAVGAALILGARSLCMQPQRQAL
jgi:Fanconi-associated nuclease 1